MLHMPFNPLLKIGIRRHPVLFVPCTVNGRSLCHSGVFNNKNMGSFIKIMPFLFSFIAARFLNICIKKDGHYLVIIAEYMEACPYTEGRSLSSRTVLKPASRNKLCNTVKLTGKGTHTGTGWLVLYSTIKKHPSSFKKVAAFFIKASLCCT